MRMTAINHRRRLRGMGCAECGDVCGKGVAVGRSAQKGLGALSFDFTGMATGLLSSFAGGGKSSGGSAGAGTPSTANVVTVSPTIASQVSPQISPVFQQQFQPQDSGLSATTTQAPAAMPALGTGVNSYPVGYPIQQPYAPATQQVTGEASLIPGVSNTTLAIAAAGGLMLFAFAGGRKRSKKAKAA